MRKTLITLFFISVIAARQPIVYFYVIPFDNLKDDPTIEWISSGLSDMVSNKFKNEPGLLIQNKQDLEVIMNDRSLMLKQPIASRNLLLLGKYSRQLEKINISIQLIDLATWEQIESKDIAAEYSDISKMKSSVAENIRSMISSYLPRKSGGVSVVLPKFIEPNPIVARDPVTVKSEMITKNLQQEFEKLEESMDVLLGLKEDEKLKPKNDVTLFDNGGEWTMDFSANQMVEENPELKPNTELLKDVLNKLIDNPYNVVMKKPNFIIAGFPKCGTTSLHHYLDEHPEIYMPTQKELHFFTYNNLSKLNKGPKDAIVKKTQINLDIYCKRKGISPDIIKIDAEGSEIKILKGAKTIIIKYKPIIFLSLHPYHIKKIGNDIHDLSNILNEIKYDIIDKNNNIPKSFKLDEYLLIPKYDKSIKKFVRNYF